MKYEVTFEGITVFKNEYVVNEENKTLKVLVKDTYVKTYEPGWTIYAPSGTTILAGSDSVFISSDWYEVTNLPKHVKYKSGLYNKAESNDSYMKIIYEYDEDGNLSVEHYPESCSIKYVYENDLLMNKIFTSGAEIVGFENFIYVGTKLMTVVSNKNNTCYVYDGDVIKRKIVDDEYDTYKYDIDGRLIGIGQSYYVYDGDNIKYIIDECYGILESYTYNIYGNVVTKIEHETSSFAEPKFIDFEYNSKQQIISRIESINEDRCTICGDLYTSDDHLMACDKCNEIYDDLVTGDYLYTIDNNEVNK